MEEMEEDGESGESPNNYRGDESMGIYSPCGVWEVEETEERDAFST
jgi:hypothetical protein